MNQPNPPIKARQNSFRQNTARQLTNLTPLSPDTKKIRYNPEKNNNYVNSPSAASIRDNDSTIEQ